MTAALVRPAEGKDTDVSIVERVLIVGDLAKLTAQERSSYYMAVCRSVGLNPLTRPFDYISLNGKLTLYTNKNATDQLRSINGISVRKIERAVVDGLSCATVYIASKDGREDADLGAVNINGLKGESLANAHMKAVTKAKRRATLSLCGLSFLDESELETVPNAKRVVVTDDGVIVEAKGPAIAKSDAPALEEMFEVYRDRIGDAKTIEELTAVGRAVAKAGFSGDERGELREIYELKLDALQGGSQEAS
jgi:hypothetical protein